MVARGDIILYRSTGKLHERIIAWATKGPYCHVAIAVDSTHTIAADANGIRFDLMPVSTTHTVISIAKYTTPEGIERGVDWAIQQQGRKYGWSDVLYQALKFLAPNNPFRFGRIDRFDCSDFCTRYLQHAGVVLPDEYSDPYANTPMDIYRLSQQLDKQRASA